jgi:hypothetical protein
MLVADEYAEALVAGADPDPVLVQRFAEAVVRAQGLGTYVSAVLLTPETFAATAALRPGDHGTSADRGPLATPVSALRRRLAALVENGASFVEWRENLPPPDVP